MVSPLFSASWHTCWVLPTSYRQPASDTKSKCTQFSFHVDYFNKALIEHFVGTVICCFCCWHLSVFRNSCILRSLCKLIFLLSQIGMRQVWVFCQLKVNQHFYLWYCVSHLSFYLHIHVRLWHLVFRYEFLLGFFFLSIKFKLIQFT